jgi:methylenetetrahydrofolate reductase (NADPH)
MRIDQMLAERSPLFSFEFFPPRTDEGVATLLSTISHLRELQPDFVSVTYGAGGSTRDRTWDLVGRIRTELGIEAMAHLTCVGASVDELLAHISALRDSGGENILALRGDPPAGTGAFTVADGGLAHGSDLTALISDSYPLCIGGACYPEKHPESASPDDDIRCARLKVDAGASFLITQLFFDNAHYFAFVDRSRASGIDVPIIPGIMPVTNVAQIQRFTSKIGASIPPALESSLEERADDPDAVIQLGVAWATLQCSELLAAGAPGIHFITLNRSPATRAILSALRIAQPWKQDVSR